MSKNRNNRKNFEARAATARAAREHEATRNRATADQERAARHERLQRLLAENAARRASEATGAHAVDAPQQGAVRRVVNAVWRQGAPYRAFFKWAAVETYHFVKFASKKIARATVMVAKAPFETAAWLLDKAAPVARTAKSWSLRVLSSPYAMVVGVGALLGNKEMTRSYLSLLKVTDRIWLYSSAVLVANWFISSKTRPTVEVERDIDGRIVRVSSSSRRAYTRSYATV